MTDTRWADRADPTLGHIAYGIYALGFLSVGFATLVSFILCLVKRPDVRGTLLESHFTWIIRTFLWTVVGIVLCIVLAVTIIGIPLAWLLGIALTVWSIYRIVVGWLKLSEGRPIPDPEAWF
jgi:uncharacterized membrane protein